MTISGSVFVERRRRLQQVSRRQERMRLLWLLLLLLLLLLWYCVCSEVLVEVVGAGEGLVAHGADETLLACGKRNR